MKLKKILNIFRDLFTFLFSSKLFLSISSFYVFMFFYLINNKILIFNLSSYINYGIYFLGGLFLSYLCLLAVKIKKGLDNQDGIESIKPVEFLYIPVYLGLVIISLGLNKFSSNILEVLIIIIIIFFVWLKLENVSFFNFYWLFFGYRFYEISTKNSSYMLISKRKDVKNKNTIKSLKLKRINNYTFLDMEK